MSQQQYPQPPQPGQGGPQGGWGTPPQPAKKSRGKFIGFGCLGVVALFILIGAIGAATGSGDDKKDDKAGSTASSAAAAPKKKDTAKDTGPAAPKTAPVRITAKKAAFAKTILAENGDYTSVAITITNNSDGKLSVNPLYFAITDSAGTKHTAELGVDDQQIATVDLAPGENVSGTVTGKGVFTPKYVTYTENLIGDPMRADVS
jgi:putative Ca2+/H+ antiporter (TMEM165/GDT1 family)